MSHQYKVGDLVQILPRTGQSSDYRFSYSGDMLSCTGKVMKILRIEDVHHGPARPKLDDGKLYVLEGSHYNWASSMFQPVTERSAEFKVGDLVVVLPRSLSFEHYTCAYVDPMLQYAGREARIVDVRKCASKDTLDDGYFYRLDIDEKHWCWSSNALTKSPSAKAVPPKPADEPFPWESPSKPETAEGFKEVEYPFGYFSSKKQESYKLDFNI